MEPDGGCEHCIQASRKEMKVKLKKKRRFILDAPKQ